MPTERQIRDATDRMVKRQIDSGVEPSKAREKARQVRDRVEQRRGQK